MNVILLERVEKLGAIGDVVKVKDGFARNFLLPNKKALRANEANRKVFEANRARIESENANRRGEAEKEAVNFKDVSVTLIRQASNTGQLYGSVAVRDLVEALVADGHKVTKSQIVLDKPIKSIGLYDVRVALHPEVAVTVKVNVARSPEEAEMQASGVLGRTVLVFGQMNEPPGARWRAAQTALAQAEYFRDEQHRDVLLLMDNVFRFVQAGQEISGLLGRRPSRVGYQPTLASDVAALQERLAKAQTPKFSAVVNAAGVWSDAIRGMDEGTDPQSIRPSIG